MTEEHEGYVSPTETEMEDLVTEALENQADASGEGINIRTFAESGVLTRNRGLVVKLRNSEFQLTIVRVDRGRQW